MSLSAKEISVNHIQRERERERERERKQATDDYIEKGTMKKTKSVLIFSIVFVQSFNFIGCVQNS